MNKNIQDVVAERVEEFKRKTDPDNFVKEKYNQLIDNGESLLDTSPYPESPYELDQDRITDWLTTTLTQLVKEVEAGEKRPDEPTRWVSEPMTQKEAEIYVQGMYDLMMMVGCDGHCKHYDPLFFEGDIAHSYVLELDDGGRRHSYVTPQWVALKALLEFAQTLKDEWDIGGWNEYFANNTRGAIEEIETLTPPTSDVTEK